MTSSVYQRITEHFKNTDLQKKSPLYSVLIILYTTVTEQISRYCGLYVLASWNCSENMNDEIFEDCDLLSINCTIVYFFLFSSLLIILLTPNAYIYVGDNNLS